jgi:peptidylprolyl isomerase
VRAQHRSVIAALATCVAVLACQGKDTPSPLDKPPPHISLGSASAGSGSASRHNSMRQIPLPDELKQPPADAIKGPEGFFYKKLVSAPNGDPIKRNDTVLVNYTGWKLPSGDTFFTTQTRGQPMPVRLSDPAPGFTDALLLFHKGEKADVWVPPEVGYRGRVVPPKPETLVYEVEILDVTPAPPIPVDVAGPPASALTLASANLRYEIIHPGSGGESPRAWDTIGFEATEWDGSGRMLETTELKKHTASSSPFRQARIVQQVLATMTPGERVRFWGDAARFAVDGRPPNGGPKGIVCYELELRSVVRAKHDPPPTPTDLDKPPADAKTTQLGVFYKVLASGAATGPHPTTKDKVTARFTGWRQDGTLFETTGLTDGKPVDVSVLGGVAGWSDVLQHMVPGDHWRVWIPAELAYKGAPGKPSGMLIYDLELTGITPKST